MPKFDRKTRLNNSIHTMFADSFEGPSLAQFWASGDYGIGPYTPGAVAMTSETSRLGRSAVGITVREGDIEQTAPRGKRAERAEFDSGKHLLLNQRIRVRFSFPMPEDFPIVDLRLVFVGKS